MKLESTIHDSPLTATINLDPSRGLKDEREMSSTLVTTEAGSAAAGFEGVSEGATGNPRQGQPNPVPLPANPLPESLQYVTVYDNGNKGGFAGSQPVDEPQNFRCAYDADAGRPQQIHFLSLPMPILRSPARRWLQVVLVIGLAAALLAAQSHQARAVILPATTIDGPS